MTNTLLKKMAIIAKNKNNKMKSNELEVNGILGRTPKKKHRRKKKKEDSGTEAG